MGSEGRMANVSFLCGVPVQDLGGGKARGWTRRKPCGSRRNPAGPWLLNCSGLEKRDNTTFQLAKNLIRGLAVNSAYRGPQPFAPEKYCSTERRIRHPG